MVSWHDGGVWRMVRGGVCWFDIVWNVICINSSNPRRLYALCLGTAQLLCTLHPWPWPWPHAHDVVSSLHSSAACSSNFESPGCLCVILNIVRPVTDMYCMSFTGCYSQGPQVSSRCIDGVNKLNIHFDNQERVELSYTTD